MKITILNMAKLIRKTPNVHLTFTFTLVDGELTKTCKCHSDKVSLEK